MHQARRFLQLAVLSTIVLTGWPTGPVMTQASPTYTVEDLGLLSGDDQSNAVAVNANDQVLGWSLSDTTGKNIRGVLWQAAFPHTDGACRHCRAASRPP